MASLYNSYNVPIPYRQPYTLLLLLLLLLSPSVDLRTYVKTCPSAVPQHQHYTRLLPAIYDDLQRLDERRSRCQQAHLRRAVDIERHVFPIIHTCLDGIVRAADTVDAEQV